MTFTREKHDLFVGAQTVSFSTQVNVPSGVRIAVATSPTKEAEGKWKAGMQTESVAFWVELDRSELPGNTFIVVSSSTEDGHHYNCVAVPPDEFDRLAADIESSVLKSSGQTR